MNEDLITTSEMAAALHVSRQTVTRWIREGRIRHREVKVGQVARYQVRRSDFAAFVKRYVRGDW